MISNPEGFWFFLLLVPVGLTAWRKYSAGFKDLKKIGGKWREEPLHTVFLVKWFFSTLTIFIFVVFCVLAISDFSWGHVAVKDERRGLDIAILLDVSRSMLSRDTDPTRLEKSFEIIRGAIDIYPESRYSLVLFKGEAYTFVPTTEDSLYIKDVLASISPGILTAPGTDIEAGLKTALASFPEGVESSKVILLLSDGEKLTGDTDDAVKRVAAAGVPVIAVGFGDPDGTLIELPNGSVVKTAGGENVISRLNEEELKGIAEFTRGTYIHADSPFLMKEIEKELLRMGREKTETDFQFEIRNRYRLFLAIALISLCFHLGIRILRWKRVF